MLNLSELAEKIISGYTVTRAEAEALAELPLDELRDSADAITKHFFQEKVEMCCISNGKCGSCSEDCKFCAQSSKFETKINVSHLKSPEEFYAEAKYNCDRGVHRFSIVTAGVRLSPKEIRQVAQAYKLITDNLDIRCCGSLGLLKYEDFVLLKESGLSRVHDNLETSRKFFPKICTTHSYDDKLNSLKAAKKAGIALCSGCIIGMGEDYSDRLDIAFELRDLGVESAPINVLNPIKGTPLENQKPLTEEEIKRTVALFRHVLPKTVLRLAGGRILMKDFFTDLYDFGINAEITGDMLTTAGYTIQTDVDAIIKSKRVVSRID